MKYEIGYDYSDIYLIPRHGILESRSEADTSVKFGGRTFKLPVVPANMKTIVDFNTCKFLAKNEIFYIMHRFNVDVVDFCKKCVFEGMFSSISVGVNKDSRDDLMKIYNLGMIPDYITIDIAHGDSILTLKMIEFIKHLFPSTFLIAGNVATSKGVRTLEKAGADATKVGIGQGCFAAGTRILLSNGTYKNIEDMTLNDEVISGTGNPTRVVGVKMTGIRKVISYKHSYFYKPTLCTPDHLHYVYEMPKLLAKSTIESKGIASFMETHVNNFGWMQIKDVSNDKLLYPRKINFKLEDSFKINLLEYSNSNKKNSDNLILDIEPSYELGYLIGAFLGDGHASIITSDRIVDNKLTKNTVTHLTFAYGINELDIVNKTIEYIKNVFGVEATYSKPDCKNMYIVNVYCANLSRFFATMYDNKNKQLNSKFIISNKKYLQGILDGLIDSDGCISEDKTTFTNTSIYLIELYSILYNIVYGKFPSQYTNKKSTGNLKNTNLLNLKDSYTVCENKLNSGNEQYLSSSVIRTEPLYVDIPVYDIEVECNSHSFIANNVIVHNSVCTTKDQTGFTVPQFTAVVNACEEAKKPVIADGGIRSIGDISKALVGGASMIMAGSLFSGYDENPPLSRQNDGKFLYYGSASAENKGNNIHVEGKVTEIDYKGSMVQLLTSIKDGVSSAISYSGGKNIEDLKNLTKFGVRHK